MGWQCLTDLHDLRITLSIGLVEHSEHVPFELLAVLFNLCPGLQRKSIERDYLQI